MNIAFDAKRITNNRTGLGNYSRFVVRGLAEHFEGDNLLLLSSSVGDSELYAALLEGQENLKLQTPGSFFARRFKTHWRNYGMRPLLTAANTQIYHGLSNEIPRGLQGRNSQRPVTIVTIHDLAFVRYPQFYKPIDRWLYRRKYGDSARHADHVIAVSEFTKRDVVELFGVPEERVSVHYQGCSPAFSAVTAQDALWARKLYGLPARYMLFVGSIEQRKNLKLAVEALPLLPDREVALVAVGRRTPYCEEVLETARRLGVAHRILLFHGVQTAHLPGVYAGAELFVYPSRFEGFGIPLLEALNAGVPVIGATGSCLEEAGGPHSLYTNPDDPAMLAELMGSVLNSPEQREQMVALGREYAQRFEEKVLARQLHTIYETVLQNT